MQAIMESIFDIAYLGTIIALGLLIIRRAKGRKEFVLFGVMAIVLGCGDAFHLVPRIWALNTTGTENFTAALGFGTLVTSISMTIFYLMLYHFWRLRYQAPGGSGLTAAVYALGLARIGLCLLPQNQWLSADAPTSWGIYRNIPFLILGIILIALFYHQARRENDGAFRSMWLAISLSFVFYIPVVLFSDTIPMIGMMMLPKTCAYVWMVWMGYSAAEMQGPAAKAVITAP